MSAEPVASSRPSWLPSFAALGLIWGGSFMFIKLSVEVLPPLYVALGRISLGAITAVILVYAMSDRLPHLTREWKVWAHNAVIGLIGVATPYTLFPYGEQHVSSVLAGIWNSVTPLVTLPVAVMIFRIERFTARNAIGMLIGFVGVLVLLGIWDAPTGSNLLGQILCFLAAVCYGFSTPYTRKYVAHMRTSGIAITACQLISATVMLLIVTPLFADIPDLGRVTLKAGVALLALGIFGTGIAYVLMMRNIRLMGATGASLVTYVTPIIAVILGIWLLGESLHWNQPVGAALVLLGVAISSRRASKASLKI